MLPSSERLKKGGEIKSVLRKKEIQGSTPLLYFAASVNRHPKSRAVIITSRKLGKAVTRNLIRRRLIAAYSKIRHKIGKNIDIVFLPRPTVANSEYALIQTDLIKAFTRTHLIGAC